MSIEAKTSSVLKVLQGIFFIVVSVGTIYNGYTMYRQSKLIYKPVIGITDVKTTRILSDLNNDTYENVKLVFCDFFIENVGNLPAKNFKIEPILKLGNTILPHTEQSEDYEGTLLIQRMKLRNRARIKKETLDKMIKQKERLIYVSKISYTDWENYEEHEYEIKYEIKIEKKEPLNVVVNMLSSDLKE